MLVELLRAAESGASPVAGGPAISGLLIDDLQLRAPPFQLRGGVPPITASFTVIRVPRGSRREARPQMTRLSSLLLIAIIGSFGALITWELWPNETPPVALVTSPPRSFVDKAEAASATDLTARTMEWAAAALARPLFNPDRRPAPEATASASQPAILPRLTGTMVGPFGRRAIFSDDRKLVIVAVGQRLAEYAVQSIEPNEVQMLGPNGTIVLHIKFQAAPRQPESDLTQKFPARLSQPVSKQ